MVYRSKIKNSGKDKRAFTKYADRIHVKNLSKFQPRGGIRL